MQMRRGKTMMGAGIQTGCLLAAILCLLYYGVILCYAGPGADFAWFWAFGGVFFLLVCLGMRQQMSHPAAWLRWMLVAAAVLTAAVAAVFLLIGAKIVAAMSQPPEQELEYVIVLGAQVRGTVPSRALRKRLDCALRCAEDHPSAVFFLSGGQGSGEEISEAECMRRYLTAGGLEEERLVMEDQSVSTWENLLFCSRLGEVQKGRTGILSNDFHVYRAGQMAKKLGYQQIVRIAAPSDPVMELHYIVREVCAVLVAAARGYMDF